MDGWMNIHTYVCMSISLCRYSLPTNDKTNNNTTSNNINSSSSRTFVVCLICMTIFRYCLMIFFYMNCTLYRQIDSLPFNILSQFSGFVSDSNSGSLRLRDFNSNETKQQQNVEMFCWVEKQTNLSCNMTNDNTHTNN